MPGPVRSKLFTAGREGDLQQPAARNRPKGQDGGLLGTGDAQACPGLLQTGPELSRTPGNPNSAMKSQVTRRVEPWPRWLWWPRAPACSLGAHFPSP